MAVAPSSTFSGRTAWARNLASPVRDFLSTETGSASVLLIATLLALLWANSPWSHSYASSVDTPGSRFGWAAEASRPICDIGSTRLDDVLLSRRRVGSQAGARRGRAASASAPHGACRCGDRRNDRPGRDLPGGQRRRPGRAWLGHCDVDRHRVRARRAGLAHPEFGDTAARVHAVARRGRRPRCAAGHRRCLHGHCLARGAAGCRGAVRRCFWRFASPRSVAASSPSRWASPCGSRCSSPVSTR